jgi:hypothetical protein
VVPLVINPAGIRCNRCKAGEDEKRDVTTCTDKASHTGKRMRDPAQYRKTAVSHC